MAYHYALDIHNGETRRIVTASLPSYERGGGWLIFDTEAERAAHVASELTWYGVCYATGGTVTRLPRGEAGYYYTRQHMEAGWALFTSEQEAREAFAAMPRSYAINPETGDTMIVRNWLSGDDRFRPGFTGEFPSARAAVASLPAPWVALSPANGYTENCYPAKRAYYKREGYIVAPTLAECRALLPVRWVWSETKYKRAYSGSLMQRPSMFARLRGALRALADGRENFRDGTQERNAGEVLRVAAGQVRLHHSFIARDALTVDFNAREIAAFAARCNKLLGSPMLGVCSHCDTFLTFPHSLQFEGRAVCINCQQSFCRCRVCDVLMHQEDARQDEDGNNVCRAHWQPILQVANGKLLSYSTDIMGRMEGFNLARGERSSSLWLGWELEVHSKGEGGETVFNEDCDYCGGDGNDRDEDGDATGDPCSCGTPSGDRASAILEVQRAARQWAIVKSDSSLTDRVGMEIVSVPASLRWHRENVIPFLGKAQRYLSGWPHNDCGIHVHVGKKELSELQQSRLVRFMHAKENQSFITQVAGRDPNTYCNRGDYSKSVGAFKQEAHIGRYQALNFATKNSATLEFRIFRSNVSPAGFMKNLEFVHALCHWSKISGEGLARGEFVHYVKQERPLYPALVRFFESNGTLPARKHHPDLILPSIIAA